MIGITGMKTSCSSLVVDCMHAGLLGHHWVHILLDSTSQDKDS